MSLLMQALRRAETAKKNQAAPGSESPATGAVAAPVPDSAGAGAELTLEHKEPTADEIAAAGERERHAAEAAAAAALTPEPDARPEPVDYFGGEVPPPRAPYVPPAAQGFDPDRGAGAGSSAPAAPAPAPAAASMPAEPAPAMAPAYAPPPAPAPQPAAQPEAARTAARAVFAAKQEVRSRRPLIIAAVGLFVLGAGASIFYYFLLPSSPVQGPYQGATAVLLPAPAGAIAPEPQAAAVAVTAPASEPLAVAVAPAPMTVSAPPAQMFPPAVTPSVQSAPPAPPRARPAPRERAVAPVADVAPPQAGERSLRANAPGAAAQIEVRRAAPARNVNPALMGAYQAFVAGDTAVARSGYQRVLQQEPDNRDALLGMAAIAANRGQGAEAQAFYGRLLELDPADAQAAAGITSLQRGDPDLAESRLKGVLAASPENGAALFALGNLYAQQARWPEAQLVYFRAVGSEPANAGYAFNLAVSLDKLNQKKLALDYYKRALQLAAKGGATVNQATTEERIWQLEHNTAPR